MRLFNRGLKKGKILVVCDAPNQECSANQSPITGEQANLFVNTIKNNGASVKDFCFLSPCAPIPVEFNGTEGKKGKWLEKYNEYFTEVVKRIEPKAIIVCGNLAARQVLGRSVKITKSRGQFEYSEKFGCSVYFMLSPVYVTMYIEHQQTFESDFNMFWLSRQNNFQSTAISKVSTDNYLWCENLEPYLDRINNLGLISVDTETTSLRAHSSSTELICVQFGLDNSLSLLCPISRKYWDWGVRRRSHSRLVGQTKKILVNPKIKKVGHNFKYDIHVLRTCLGIEVMGWEDETILLAFNVNDCLSSYSLDECVRLYVPEMAGFNDDLNKKIDKTDMMSCDPEDLRVYGGGDVDGTYRLRYNLIEKAKNDRRHYKNYRHVWMPAIRAFAYRTEKRGVLIDRNEHERLKIQLKDEYDILHEELLKRTPESIKEKHIEAKKDLSFTRADLVRDLFFSPEGENIKPIVFTKSTKRLSKDERVPSTSIKDHLKLLDPNDKITLYINWKTISTFRSNFVDNYDKFINERDEIHPSYSLHTTRTGRTSSRDPNGQNAPKRGELAKQYRKIFKARPGYILLDVDYSQAELRTIAIVSGDPTMLEIYANDRDMHARTAAYSMGISVEEFNNLDPETFDLKRYYAKAINFGFCYGMLAPGFVVYAKTTYNIDYTVSAAEESRDGFMELYFHIPIWHDTTRNFVRKHGFIRGLHGCIHRYPSINSTDKWARLEAERQAINAPIQKFSSDLGLLAMKYITRDAPEEIICPIGFVHDSLIFEVKEEHIEECTAGVKYYMENLPLKKLFGLDSPIPFRADSEVGYNLGEMSKSKIAPAKPSWFGKKTNIFV